MLTAKAQISLHIHAVYQDLHHSLTESLDTTVCMTGEPAQDNLHLHTLCMFEGTFSLDAAQLF